MNNKTWTPYGNGQLTKSQFTLLTNQAGYRMIITYDEVDDLHELVQRGFVQMSGLIEPGCFIDHVTEVGHQYRQEWYDAYAVWLETC